MNSISIIFLSILYYNNLVNSFIANSNHVLIKDRSLKHNKAILQYQHQQVVDRNNKKVLLSSTPNPSTINYEKLEINNDKQEIINVNGNYDNEDTFTLLSATVYSCLKESDKRRDAKQENTDKSPAGATNWIDEQSAFLVQQVLNKISLKLPEEHTNGYDRDEASIWLRWMKLSPVPLVIDLSKSLRGVIKSDDDDVSLLNRITCKLYILPSGMELSNDIITPVGSMHYGKLLYGGIKRYRILSSKQNRRTSERIAVKSTIEDNLPCWIQYGGSNRNYEALDIGPACVFEIGLYPLHIDTSSANTALVNKDMTIDNFLWSPKNMIHFHKIVKPSQSQQEENSNYMLPSMLSGQNRNEAFTTTFESRVGGLNKQIEAIVRRVLDGRVIRPILSYDDEDNYFQSDDEDEYFKELSNTKLEADELSLLGLSPVKGLLLYGPPGCGKTVLAREISYALQARKPKIVSAPELLDRWVGGSERLIRDLFADAEAELASVKGDASKSALHVIVIDEIDAVFRKRSSSIQQDSGEATRSSAVNQILAKLDGVNAIPNVLLIGMTNRRELLDEALLRPGRLEVQIHIPLPDEEGRRDILKIHFDLLRKKGRLSLPLCMAIDGEQSNSYTTKKRKFKQTLRNVIKPFSKKHNYNNIDDLACDSVTGGFSGADIAGLVRCAGSIALARARSDGSGVDGLLITLEDVIQALKEVKGIK